MLLDKASLSYRFHMCDSEGHSLPRLRSKECASLEFNFLNAVAESIIGGAIPKTPWLPGLPDGLTSAFRRITTSVIRDGEATYNLMHLTPWGLRSEQRDLLFGNANNPASEFFRISVKVLTECHILCALVPGEPDSECMVKITTDVPQSWSTVSGKPWRELPRLLGWTAWGYKIVPPVSDPRSYHCELWTPPGVEIDPRSPGLTPALPQPHVGFLGRHGFHLAAHDFGSGPEYILLLRLRSELRGWLPATLATCLAVLALLCVGRAESADLVAAKTSGTSSGTPLNLTVLLTTILLAVGAASITILAKSSSKSHALEDEMLAGLRGVSWCIPVVCFSAVLILFCVNSTERMECGFLVLLAVQCVILVLLILPWYIRRITSPGLRVTAPRQEAMESPGLSWDE
ncbi:hypothetical protein [Streptomyces sp. G-G2]|uniref:hypothetical protein n=1 Tax=Streptomyces sp. G-G2 TaxID=3046201 RepID=UPI0024BB1419|nr:hypothetical protein [Streptomyces sp. G-G2]MDJ0386291.1 hypothetical protein [Streptomyces sp. G-G2]